MGQRPNPSDKLLPVCFGPLSSEQPGTYQLHELGWNKCFCVKEVKFSNLGVKASSTPSHRLDRPPAAAEKRRATVAAAGKSSMARAPAKPPGRSSQKDKTTDKPLAGKSFASSWPRKAHHLTQGTAMEEVSACLPLPDPKPLCPQGRRHLRQPGLSRRARHPPSPHGARGTFP